MDSNTANNRSCLKMIRDPSMKPDMLLRNGMSLSQFAHQFLLLQALNKEKRKRGDDSQQKMATQQITLQEM
jgi:hypothetical protein